MPKVICKRTRRIARVISNTPESRNAWDWPKMVEDGLASEFQDDLAEDAQLLRVDPRMGLAGNSIDTTNLILAIGPKRAMGLLSTSDTASGSEAAEIGLVNAAVQDGFAAEAERWAQWGVSMPLDGIAIGEFVRIQAFHSLGLLQGLDPHVLEHTLFTNLRWEDDECNFFRERRESDTAHAWRKRDDFYDAVARDDD